MTSPRCSLVALILTASRASFAHSPNTADFGAPPATVMTDSTFVDGNLFWDALEGVRFGAEYAHFEQKYADHVKAKNERLQVSAFYIFCGSRSSRGARSITMAGSPTRTRPSCTTRR
jgi:hypothetical protein